MAKSLLCALLFAILLYSSAFSQGFQNAVNQLGVNCPLPNVYNGSGLSCVDFNLDGWDDISVCTHNAPVKFFINNQGGSFTDTVLVDYEADIKAVLWVDLDNDIDLDLILTASLGLCKVYENIGDLNLIDVSASCGIPQTLNALSYGVSASDFNRDGWTDLYFCNYNWPSGETNWLMKNNGDFTFANVSAFSEANDGNRRSFQSAFIDLEHDLWPDLYVINDKNTRNSLFQNQAGEFHDISEISQTDVYMESMSNSWCDFDHDGDLDVYITNGPIGNAFLRNDNGVFVDVAPQLNMTIGSLCWGALWFDFNGDSWEDLYVCDIFPYLTDQNIVFINNGDGSFTQQTPQGMLADNFSSYACGFMDIDNNQAPDLVVVNTSGQNISIWKNNVVGYNAFGIELINQQGITGGLGSWVHVYANGTVQNRYVISGDNYLSQNSQKLFFAIGNELTADSVLVHWPSGWIDTFYNVPKDSLFTWHEGETAQVISLSGNVTLCPGDSALIQFASPIPPAWSDGYVGYSRWVSQSGQFSAALEWLPSQWVFSDTVHVLIQDSIFPSLDIHPILCFGQSNASIELNMSTCEGCFLIDSDNYEGLGPGAYSVIVADSLGCTVQIEGVVLEPAPLTGDIESIEHANSGVGGSITVEIDGGTLPYEFNWSDGSSSQNISNIGAGNYQCIITDANGCEITLEESLIDLKISDLHPDCGVVFQNRFFHFKASGRFTVFNAIGQVIIDQKVNQSERIDVMNLASGVYFYTFHPFFVERMMKNGRFYLD
jgi:hypothetical protein